MAERDELTQHAAPARFVEVGADRKGRQPIVMVLRDLVGELAAQYVDQMAGRPIRRTTYDCVSCLNRGHMNWAWASLFWVAFTDIYVRLCAMGIWRDWRLM